MKFLPSNAKTKAQNHLEVDSGYREGCTLVPVANNAVTWRDWEIEHSDDGLLVSREFARGSFIGSDTFSASLTCAMGEGELTCYDTSGHKYGMTTNLSQTLKTQLDTIYDAYASAGLYDDLLENRE